MDGSNNPTDSWFQFYQQTTPPATSSMTGGTVSDSTVVSSSQSPGPHGSRPIRRRSRASRRTPTTVLNTNPTNFRAMVQQFTGGYANTTSPYQRRPIGSTVFDHPREAHGSQETRQQIVSSETVYRQFLQLQLQQQLLQQQQQQEIHDVHDSSDRPSSETREAPGFINSSIEDGRQQLGSSETIYSQFLRRRQQQQQQQRHDIQNPSEDAFLRHGIRNFGSDGAKNEPSGHQ